MHSIDEVRYLRYPGYFESGGKQEYPDWGTPRPPRLQILSEGEQLQLRRHGQDRYSKPGAQEVYRFMGQDALGWDIDYIKIDGMKNSNALILRRGRRP